MKCPKCGGIIEYDDTYDSSSCDNIIIEYCCGHCLNCNTEYQWKEIYNLERTEDLEELV